MTALTAARKDERLFERYRDPADHIDLEAVVGRFMPLARQVARRFASCKAPYEDLLQVASLALLRAIDRYDPARRVAFASYAMPSMTGAIKRHYRDATWPVHVPGDLKELALAVDATRERLTSNLGRAPSPGELADAVQAGEREVADAQLALAAATHASLDELTDEDSHHGPFPEALRYADGGYERAELRAMLDALRALLDDREREVLQLRFDEDLCQREIGERIGVSQMQVSRIQRHALATLSDAAAATDEPPPPRLLRGPRPTPP